MYGLKTLGLLCSTIFLVSFWTVSGLDILTCTQHWLQVTNSNGFLYEVDCSNRGFTSIPKLPTITSVLLLNGNSISTVDHNAFAGLTSLHSADLSGNDIVYLDERVFQDTKDLKSLNLIDNKLLCDWRIWWLVSFAKNLENFEGHCFSPRALRGKSIKSLNEEELAVDCQSVKKMTGASSDGEYEMRVFARDNSITKVFIYCHQMDTDNPSEFLGLPSGKEKNYVSVKPDKACPYGSSLKQTLKDMNTTVHFSYVKIDLAKLWLVANDTSMNPLSQLSFGKPTICDDNLCVNGISSVDLRGTHFRLKGSKITTKMFECKENCGKCSFPNYLALDLVKSRKHPFSACTLPLGMQNKEINDSSISASSNAGKFYHPSFARLNSIEYSGWCAGLKNDQQYLIVDLGKEMTVSGISTQGYKKQQDWVKSYKLFYSNGSKIYTEHSNVKGETVFKGNYDRYSVVTHWFQPRFTARYIKVQPLTWFNQESIDAKICMRMELYGCASDINSYIIQPTSGAQCLTIGDNASVVNGQQQYPLVKKTGCKGEDFMFTFHQRKIMHTKTGLCLHNSMDGLVFNTSCTEPAMMFQKVALQPEFDSFLIKDYNGACARLFGSQNSNLHVIWRKCKKGGFSIFKMTRDGVSAFQPLFGEKEVDVTTDLFVPLNLTCKARADPLPIYQWSRDKSMHDVRDIGTTDSINGNATGHNGYTTLILRNVTWNDRGAYFCNAWNSKGYKYKKYNLQVNPLQWFEKSPKNQKTIYGENAQFDCLSKGVPAPTVSWLVYDESVLEYRNVLDVDNRKFEMLSNGTLVIKKVSYYDEKGYICVSTSPGLVRNTSVSLDVHVTQDFTVKPAPQKVLYGSSNAIFDCVSEGRPTPSIKWMVDLDNRDNLVTVDDSLMEKYKVLQNGSLLVKTATLDDVGRYYCISESPGLTKNVSNQLSVYVTQSFRTEPQNAKILYGYNYTVQCESVGVPTPNVTWMFKRTSKSKPVPLMKRTNSKVTLKDDGNLLITNASSEETGEYFCISHSPGLTRNSSGIIEIYVTQNFTQKPQSQIVLQGEYMVSFSCISSGIPTPIVTWRFQRRGSNTPLLLEEFEDHEHQSMPNNDFVIRNVRNEDEGTYICISESPGFVVNTTATLDVHTPPEVIIPQKKISKFSQQSVEITCATYGDPEPSVVWYKMTGTADGEKELLSDKSNDRVYFEDGMLTLNRLVKGDEGKYVCEASNAAGKDAETVMLNVTILCSIAIKNSTLTPSNTTFEMGATVNVACIDGFRLNGVSNLVCTETGKFNNILPTCEDIDECKEQSEKVASGSNLANNELCEVNAQCRNIIGSYECICDEGYMKADNKCVYSPSGSGSSNPGTGKVPESGTPLRKEDYSWLYDLIAQYKRDIIEEEHYLSKMLKFTENITYLKYSLWREDALTKVSTDALKIVITKNKLNYGNKSIRKNIKLFATIVSTLLEGQYNGEWENVNKESCGTICLMKYFESYLRIVVPKMRNRNLEMSFKNLDVKLLPVNETFKVVDMEVSMLNRDTSNENMLRMPSGNYQLLKGSTSIGILYKTTHRLLPTPVLAGIDSAELLTEVFSISFTSLEDTQRLLQPAQIVFAFKEEPSNNIDDSVCSFWDFKKDNNGSWSTEGCEKLNISSSKQIICQCNHLTNFAVLVPKASTKMIYLTFSIAVAACVGFCILVAFITCMSHACCSHYVNSDRRTILVNITLTIMLLLLIIAGGVFMSKMKFVPEKYSTYFCFTLVGALQLFGCAFFAWTLAEAIHLYLSSRIVINKGNGRLVLFYFIGWGIPLCIVAATGVLVYFDQFQLQSRCVLNISLYLLSILIGAPSLLFILATFLVYILIRVNMASDKELLNVRILTHTKGSMLCSFCLILIHVLVIGATAMFLRFNTELLYHYILAGLTAVEALYLLFYHCYVDRKAGRPLSREGSKNRNSYSTKETVTYSPNGTFQYSPNGTSPNGTASNGTSSNPEIAEEANEQKYLIRRSSKRLSKGESTKPSPPSVRNIQQSSDEAIEWDSSYQGMYGANNTNQSAQAEKKPLLPNPHVEFGPGTPSTFRGGSFSKNSTLSKNGTFPRRWHDSEDGNESVNGNQRPLLKRSNSKGSSILSIETHTSSNAQQGLPVYFPTAPPHYEMSLERKNHEMHNINSYLADAETSRPTSFGIEPDRVSNLSSELSNILYELQAFDTNRPPTELHRNPHMPTDHGSQTLPIRREPPIADISRNQTSTFKPSSKDHSKTEITFDEAKPPSYTDHHRVRLLRGKNRQEADPADGLHTHNSDSVYSSL